MEPRVITVVDGVLGLESIKAYPEAAAQVTSADVAVVSKVDIADAGVLAEIDREIRALNPWAEIRRVNLVDSRLSALFAAPEAPLHRAGIDMRALLATRPTDLRAGPGDGRRHGEIATHSIVLDEPLDWTAFGVWMTMLLHRHGDRVLRVKGLLAVDGLPGPTLFQSAQHLVHAPVHMDAWPSSDKRSRIVFIVRGIDPRLLQTSLLAFERASRRATPRPAEQRSAGSGGVIAGRPVKRPTAPAWIRG